MRRTLLASLLVLPLAARGETAGTMTLDSSTINIVQCNGAQNADAGTSDALDLGMTWTVALASGGIFTTGGQYKVYASNEQPAAGVSTTLPLSCTDAATSSSTFSSVQIGSSSYDASSQSMTATQSISMASIASQLGMSCAVTSAVKTVYLCVQWLDSTGVASGYATGRVTLSLARPAAPTVTSVGPGDGSLYVSCSAGDSNSSAFKIKAWPTADPAATAFSGESSSSSAIQVKGLTNGTAYTVAAYAFNSAHNPSDPSATSTGTPAQTDDFWSHYKGEGGPESGGCSSAAGAAGLLGALSLLALRRRKP